jgi:DNA invertase Pin-like site-specific DNA recombinase
MMKMCEAHQIDLILVKSVSRFGRNVKESLEYTRRLRLLGIGVQFEKEGIFTLSLGDEMLLNVFSAIAQEESQALSQNLRLSIVKRMELGEFVDPHPPYGYRFVNKQLVIYEPEAILVRQIFDKYLAGCSSMEIARELNERGVPTKEGAKEWTAKQIRYMLTNERYIGDCRYQKTYSEPTVPFKSHRNHGEEDQYYAKDTHPAIVEREVFAFAQTLLSKRKAQFAEDKYTANRYPLSGKIRCAECGSGFLRRVMGGTIKWGCREHVTDSTRCNSFYYSEERIYDGFVSLVNKLRFAEEDILGAVISRLELAELTYKRNNTTASNMSQSIAELNGKLLMLDNLRTKGYLASDVYQIQAGEINKEIARLKNARQQTLQSQILEMLTKVKELKMRIDEIEEPLEQFDEKLFVEIIQEMTLTNKDELTFTLIGGLKFTEVI